MANSNKRKQKTLSLEEKVRICDEFEKQGRSHESLATQYGVGLSSIFRFLKQRKELRKKLECFKEHGVQNRKTMKMQAFPLLEKALYIWILQQREENIILAPYALRIKAECLLKQLQDRGHYIGQQSRTAHFSTGWFRQFKSRFGLHVKRVAGEKASADYDAYIKFKEVILERINEMGLKKSQIYNADESALFVKMLASRSVLLSSETKPAGRKVNKMRYTFMPCSNADGSNKLNLVFIGTAAKPRSLPAKEYLPVNYYSSKNAWMTQTIFRAWFHNNFIPAVRQFSNENNLEPKALLVLDNCTAHHEANQELTSDDGCIKVINFFSF